MNIPHYSLTTDCYYEPKSVQECLQIGVDFKELVVDEDLFGFNLNEYRNLEDKEEMINRNARYKRKSITRYKYDEISSVDSFHLKYGPSYFEKLMIDGNFATRFNQEICPNTLFIWIQKENIHTFTMPEQGQYVVPYLETDDEHVKTEEVIESQGKFLAQQLRMIQLTQAKCLIAQRDLFDILEEVSPPSQQDILKENTLYSTVPPKYHWFVYLTEGVETAFKLHEDMVAYDFHRGKLWVNPNIVVGDVQEVIDRVSAPGYSYQQEWEK